MENDPRAIFPGARVKVFDSSLFKDDISTPLSMTMQPATVLRRYGMKSISHANVSYGDYGEVYGKPDVWLYPDLVDVRFDYDGRESKGHFTKGVELLEQEEAHANQG